MLSSQIKKKGYLNINYTLRSVYDHKGQNKMFTDSKDPHKLKIKAAREYRIKYFSKSVQ